MTAVGRTGLLGFVLLVATVLPAPNSASAFNRERVPSTDDAGAPLFWRRSPVPYSIQSRCALGDDPNALNAAVTAAGEDEATFNQLCQDAIQRAFTSWTLPTCTSLRFDRVANTEVKEVGYDRTSSSNLNTVQFMTVLCDQVVDPSDACFEDNSCDGKYSCFGAGDYTVALTSTFVDAADGQILDADIEANAATYQFSAEVGEPLEGTIDVQNTFTHEAGHFIGLAHSCEQGATCTSDLTTSTMYWRESDPGETAKRTLKQDDIDGVCTIYPLSPPSTGGCGAASGGGELSLLPLLIVLAGLWGGHRKQSRVELRGRFRRLKPRCSEC